MKRRRFLFLSACGLLPPSVSRSLFGRPAHAGSSDKRMVQTRLLSQDTSRKSAWPDLSLWYRQPAANWNEALPIGNGRLAAMVLGGPQSERIQLNEDAI